MGVFVRGEKLWLRFKDEGGRWVSRPTPYYVGDEDRAESMYRQVVREIERRIGAGLTGPITVRAYFESWIADRYKSGISSARDEETRLRKHAMPVVGEILLAELRVRDVRALVMGLRRANKLAPRTIHHVYATLKTMLVHATADELIPYPPTTLPRGTLPAKEDADPEWRAGAVFTRGELELLISHPAIPVDRQLLVALKGLGGLRHGEAAGLKWRHYDARREPLGGLLVANSYARPGTKTGRTRQVPVHAVVAALLAEWRMAWPSVYDRQPGEDDLILPTRRLRHKGRIVFRPREANAAQKRFRLDLDELGIRARRGHDLRRTMISLALADGARREHLELITHGAKRGDAFDLYHTPPWEPLCAAISCLRIERRAGRVVRLRAVEGDQ